MFRINSIAVPQGYSATIFGGTGGDLKVRAPGDLLAGVYFVCVPGLGTLFIEDIGWYSGAWAVRLNGQQNAIWLYQGEGQATLAIDIDGNITLAGGTPVTGKLITSMADSGLLSQCIVKAVQQSPAYVAAWNQDAMSVMYTFGFPRICMYNMNPNCCSQYVAGIRALQLSASSLESDIAAGDVGALDGWWSCTLCKAGLYGAVAAITVVTCSIIVATGGGAAALAPLEESASIAAIAAATGIGVARVAKLAAAAFAAASWTSFVGDFVELLCQETGACSA